LIGAHAFGNIIMVFFGPILLRYSNPVTLLRRTLLLLAPASLLLGCCAVLTGIAFAIAFCVLRVLVGALVSVVEMSAAACGFRLVSEDQIRVIVALQLIMRNLGTLLGPAFGGFIYPHPGAGWTLPYFVGSMIFVLLALITFLISYKLPLFEPRERTVSLMQLLRVLEVWPLLICNCLLGLFFAYMMEPLYNPIFSVAPYSLSYADIGLMASIIPLVQVVSMIFTTVFTRRVSDPGPSAQQMFGHLIITLGVILIGPSPIFFGLVNKSVGLSVGALSLLGVGGGMVILTQPTFMLRIMWRERGWTKDDLGGVNAAVGLASAMLGMLIGPTISSGLLPVIGFDWLSTGYVIMHVPAVMACANFLRQYSSPRQDDFVKPWRGAKDKPAQEA